MTAKILIADKSDEIGVVCEKELKSLGYDVVLCDKNGDTVIKYLDSQHFDAVLMDVFMSSADGMEVIEHINESLTQRPCIVLLSAVNSSDFEERMIEAGADYYFIKPIIMSGMPTAICWMLPSANRSSTLPTIPATL